MIFYLQIYFLDKQKQNSSFSDVYGQEIDQSDRKRMFQGDKDSLRDQSS